MPGKQLKVTVAPKGAGSENMSALRMFNPTEAGSIKNFVLETVINAGGMPCPPLTLGLGIGALLTKQPGLQKKPCLSLLIPL